jgi:hypothetical protein
MAARIKPNSVCPASYSAQAEKPVMLRPAPIAYCNQWGDLEQESYGQVDWVRTHGAVALFRHPDEKHPTYDGVASKVGTGQIIV